MPGFDHFNFLAPFYDTVIGWSGSEVLLDLLDLQPGFRVLDAAGGTGRVAQALRVRCGGVFIADQAFNMLRQTKKWDGLKPACASVVQLPFQAGTFDRILMVDALHHVADQAGAAQEMWRVLKPGGKLVIEEPDIRSGAVKLIALGETLAGMKSHFLPDGEIAKLFSAMGGKIQTQRQDHTAWVRVEK
jgi:ubiquinone/menaquinone biosynthesis C-methylase UbiE